MADQSSKKYNDAATKKLWEVLGLSYYTSQEKINKIKQQIAAGADVNSADKDGKTLLMYACAKCYLGEVLPLMEAGASVFLKNKYGKTVLDFAKGNKTDDREKIIAKIIEETPEGKQRKAEEEKAKKEAEEARKKKVKEAEEAIEEANRQFNLALLQANEHSVQEMLFLVLTELRKMNTLLENIEGNTSLTESHTYDLLFKYSY